MAGLLVLILFGVTLPLMLSGLGRPRRALAPVLRVLLGVEVLIFLGMGGIDIAEHGADALLHRGAEYLLLAPAWLIPLSRAAKRCQDAPRIEGG